MSNYIAAALIAGCLANTAWLGVTLSRIRAAEQDIREHNRRLRDACAAWSFAAQVGSKLEAGEAAARTGDNT